MNKLFYYNKKTSPYYISVFDNRICLVPEDTTPKAKCTQRPRQCAVKCFDQNIEISCGSSVVFNFILKC